MELLSDVFQHNQINVVVEKVEIFGLLIVVRFSTFIDLVECVNLIHNHRSQVLCSWICMVDFAALVFFFADLFHDRLLLRTVLWIWSLSLIIICTIGI